MIMISKIFIGIGIMGNLIFAIIEHAQKNVGGVIQSGLFAIIFLLGAILLELMEINRK